jgi:hypothetical protein
MKAHLLNWTLGPAILGAIFASAGAVPPPPPALEVWLGYPREVLGVAGFFGAWYLVMLVLRATVHRLNEGRFVWAEVRVGAAAMAIQCALLVVALAVLLAVHHLAVLVTGGWPRSWRSAVGGAIVGAGVGLLLGLGVARLRLTQRLGLGTAAPGPPPGSATPQGPAEPGAGPDRGGS